MCYNYKSMVRSNIKRSIHDKGYAEALASLSDDEKRIWEEKAAALSSGENDGEALIEVEIAEAKSTYPGTLEQVIPITSKVREYYYFGFLPPWATHFKDVRKNYNARTDTVRVKPTWKNAWKKRQFCLICAAGFYEKYKPENKRYFFGVTGKEEIFFAGIYNHWKDPATGEIAKTFAIITTEPNSVVEPIHPRMPVILSDEDAKKWFDVENYSDDELFSLLRPFPPSLMYSEYAPEPPRKQKGPELNLEF
jgi:putative SOS response-associated peptidase YedK